MAGTRLELQAVLQEVIGRRPDGLPNVYFQPPSTVRMNYPCIIYRRDQPKEVFANDEVYLGMTRYMVTVVDSNPDSVIPSKLSKLRYCSFSNHYAAENLNHDVYKLYF